MPRQKAICILGMHRSGTSAVARAVNLLGAYICREDQRMPPKADNPDGFWEHMEIYYFHERLLEYLSRSWESVMPMPEEWWKKPGVEPYRLELMDLILREFEGQPLWMWKDPRTSLLLPLWREALQELEIDVSYLICVRNPLDVAASLRSRDNFPKFKSLALWYLHNVSSSYWTEGCRRTVVHYDHFLENWESSLRKLSAWVDIPWPQSDTLLRDAVSDFLKPSSRHSHSDLELLRDDVGVPESIKSIYLLLIEAEKNQGFSDSVRFSEEIAKLHSDYRTYANLTCSFQPDGFVEVDGDSQNKMSIAAGSQNEHGAPDPRIRPEVLTPDPIDPLRFPFHPKPNVSIIIPVWNKWEYTYPCLQSILKNTEEVTYEVILVDNGSSDETPEMLRKIQNIKVIRNESNFGFLPACNQGAAKTQGDHILFLNNDTIVTQGWLKAMSVLMTSDETIGAVGAKLIYPDGKLQEAGGMIFSDGRGWNFGNGDDPEKEIYNRIHEVDYCSGACLLVRKSLFHALGGFDERYSPAYYEEADLCFALRKMGYQVLYNPRAVVIHYESVTAGKDVSSSFRKYIEINRQKFAEKWKDQLIGQDEHPDRTGEPPGTASRERLFKPAARPKARATPFEPVKRRGLIFFPQNPYPSKTGAHKRCLAVLRGLKELGYEVTLFSSRLSASYPWQEKSVRYLQNEMGVHVEVYEDTEADREFIDSVNSIGSSVVNWNVFTPPGMVEHFRQLFIRLRADITILNYAYWAGLAREGEFNSALKVIDTLDLVTLSTKMWQLAGGYLKDPPFSFRKVDPSFLEEDFYRRKKLKIAPEEYQIYDQFDYTIAVSQLEMRTIRDHTSYTRVVNIPITSPTVDVNNSYGGPPLFVMGDNPFNIQGYLFFTAKILQTVKSRWPGFEVRVVGETTHQLLPAEGVQLLGYVQDLTPLYTESMFALCPVMGGTGMPVKVIEAMAHGVPVIALRGTGQEIPVEHGETGFIAENAAEFADYMLQLHSDRTLCRKMGEAARNRVARHYSEQVLLEKLSEIALGRPNVLKPRLTSTLWVNELSKKLREIKADRAARLEQINKLTRHLQESEADRTARLEVINRLDHQLTESEADRVARLEVINRLDQQLGELKTDHEAHLEVINRLNQKLAELKTDREARLTVVSRIHLRLRAAQSFLGTFRTHWVNARLRTGASLSQVKRKFTHILARRKRTSPDQQSKNFGLPAGPAKGTPCIAVDLSPLLPGDENDEAKQLAIGVIEHLSRLLPECKFVLLTSEENHDEFAITDSPNVDRICFQSRKVEKESFSHRFIEGRLYLRVREWAARSLPRLFHSETRDWYSIRFSGPPSNPGILKGIGADLLFCPFTLSSFYDPAVPVVSVIHDLKHLMCPQYSDRRDYDIKERNFRDACRLADRLICISDYLQRAVLENTGLSPERVVSIPVRLPARLNKPEAKKISDVLASYEISENNFLLYPSNFYPHKNHPMLFTAFGMYHSRHLGSRLRLVCAGEGDARMEVLREAVSRMGLSQLVSFPGSLSDEAFASLLAACKALIFPSLYEGFGTILLEAMAFDKPILCSNVTSLPEVAGDGALFFDPRKPDEILDAIERIAIDSPLREGLVKRGRYQSALFKNTELMACEYLKIFNDVIKGGCSDHVNLRGVYPDRWTHDRTIITYPATSDSRHLHMTFEVPAFSPHKYVSVNISEEGVCSKVYRIMRGESLVIDHPLALKRGSVDLFFNPTFQPKECGINEDERQLGCICRECFIQSGTGTENLLEKISL